MELIRTLTAVPGPRPESTGESGVMMTLAHMCCVICQERNDEHQTSSKGYCKGNDSHDGQVHTSFKYFSRLISLAEAVTFVSPETARAKYFSRTTGLAEAVMYVLQGDCKGDDSHGGQVYTTF